MKEHKTIALIVIALTAITILVWVVVFGSLLVEQSENYRRAVFTIQDAMERQQDIRWFSLELFNPGIEQALANYRIMNPMHNARYIGVFLIPLLACVPFYTWNQRDRWLVISAVSVLLIILMPPLLPGLWKILPTFNRIRHFFYFYTHFWQLLLALLAASVLDRVIHKEFSKHERQSLSRVAIILTALSMISMIILFGLSPTFPDRDQTLQTALKTIILLAISRVALIQTLRAKKEQRYTFAMFMIVVAFFDLSSYFVQVSTLDREFTQARWKLPYKMSESYNDSTEKTRFCETVFSCLASLAARF